MVVAPVEDWLPLCTSKMGSHGSAVCQSPNLDRESRFTLRPAPSKRTGTQGAEKNLSRSNRVRYTPSLASMLRPHTTLGLPLSPSRLIVHQMTLADWARVRHPLSEQHTRRTILPHTPCPPKLGSHGRAAGSFPQILTENLAIRMDPQLWPRGGLTAPERRVRKKLRKTRRCGSRARADFHMLRPHATLGLPLLPSRRIVHQMTWAGRV